MALVFCSPTLFISESAQYQLFCALSMLLVVAGLVGSFFRPQLRIATRGPSTVMCGDRFEIVIETTNLSTRSCFDLKVELEGVPDGWTVEETPDTVNSLESGAVNHFRFTIRAIHRGVFAWPKIVVGSTFPFHLVRRTRTLLVEDKLIVFPFFQKLAAANLFDLGSSILGDQLEDAPKVGDAGEFFGNREYQPGMVVRRFDYCSWARLGAPVVREFHDSLRSSAALFVDTFVARPSETEAIEPVLSLAAALVDRLDEMGCRIELLVIGSGVVRIEGGPTKSREAIFEMLASATAEPEDELASAIRDLELQPLNNCAGIALLRDWNATRSRLCDSLTSTPQAIKRVLVGRHEVASEQDASRATLPADMTTVSTSEIESGMVEIS